MVKFIFNRIKIWLGFVVIFVIMYYGSPLIWDQIPRLTNSESLWAWLCIGMITLTVCIEGAIDYSRKN